jgi:hypothetical protein
VSTPLIVSQDGKIITVISVHESESQRLGRRTVSMTVDSVGESVIDMILTKTLGEIYRVKDGVQKYSGG